jgi:hypothetical protein
MKGKGKEIGEKICVERFLNWYNKRHNSNYTYEKAMDRFSDLKDGLNWDFIGFEHDNPEEWIGIEVKELQFLRETSIRYIFWKNLCSELNKHLHSKGIQGEFEISFPPAFDLRQKERQKFLEAFSRALIDKQSGWQVGKSKDIGPDIWSRFPNLPTEESELFNEYDKFGPNRPSKLEIRRVSASGCMVRVVTSPLITGDVVEEEEKAFNEAFRLDNGRIQSDRQLELAKGKGARETILLLAGIGVDEGLTKNSVQNLDHDLISNIDCIYLVDMGDKDRVIKIYRIGF